MGIDRPAIEAQLVEKAERRATEKAHAQAYAKQQRDLVKHLKHVDLENRMNHSDRKDAMNMVWEQQVRDKKDREQRVREEDMRLERGLGIQFSGVDKYAATRKAMQAAQMKSWCDQSAADKKAKKQEQRDDERSYAHQVGQYGVLRKNIEDQEKASRRTRSLQVAKENQMLAMLTNERKRQALADDALEKQQEMAAINSSAWLGESESHESSLGDGRLRTDGFKGFTKAMYSQLIKDQASAVALKQERKITEKMQRLEEQKQMRAQQQYLMRMQLREEQEAQDARMIHLAKLKDQMRESSERKRQSKVKDTKPGMDDDFFRRFGKSDR